MDVSKFITDASNLLITPALFLLLTKRDPNAKRYPVRITMQVVVLFIGVMLALPSIANAQCPAVGADTDCGTVITVTNSGISISNNQGPFDQIEDTLVGVVNNSDTPITSLSLSSGLPIFSFDYDGICGISPNTNLPYVPAPSGCPFGPTTYEGPGVTFNVTNAFTGTVNFGTPIAAKNGTAYYSLEEALSSANATCADIINNSVSHTLLSQAGHTGGSPAISATFTPNFGYTLAQAAQLCGFVEFDWQSTVKYFPTPAPYWYAAGSTTPATWPHNDPPLTGYAVNPPGQPPNAVEIPVYYNVFVTSQADPLYLLSLVANESPAGPNANTLSFYDAPGDPCLPGGLASVRSTIIAMGWAPQSCLQGVPATSPKPYEQFETHLVGIQGLLPGAKVVDTGIGFDWRTTNNGTTGGISVQNTSLPPDPDSGTGGITVTNVNETTTYQYPKSLSVTAINGQPVNFASASSTLLTGAQVSNTASGLAYSRIQRTFNGTLTITNISSNDIAGPFQVVLTSLTSGVTLANATSTFGGWPFITIPNVGTLAPGQSATVSVQFANPSYVKIDFIPLIYTGSFN